jgi:pyruvate dehydrogenase (quinone)
MARTNHNLRISSFRVGYIAAQYDGPALIDVVTSRQELSISPTVELKQAVGFSLYMAKAVLNGRGDEIIDLAKTNIFP